MAVKAETIRVATPRAPRQPALVRMFADAIKRWGERGRLGSSALEMRTYTGAR